MGRALFLLGLSLSFSMLPARSQDAINWIGRAQMNNQIKNLWTDHGVGLVTQQLTQSLDQIGGTYYNQGNLQVWIYDVWGIQPAFAPAPGFEKLEPTKLQLRLPLSGSWGVQFKAKLKVKYKVWFFWVSDTFTLTVKAKNVWARAKATIDNSDPEAPKVAQASQPELHFKLSLSTNKWYLSALLWIFNPLINAKLKDAVDDALESLMPALEGLSGKPTPVGTGGPGVSAPTDNFDFETPAVKIAQAIQAYHLPYQTLVGAVFENPYLGKWEDSWGADPGPVAAHVDWGDSAIWTGHALAAESFRYKLTGDPQAKALIQTMLAGITNLVNMKGTPGWLNRAVQPLAASAPPTNGDYVAEWNGEPHVMTNFISRDQYMGVFFGLSLAYDLVDDSAIKASAKKNIEDMIDYLLGNKWVAFKPDGTISTVWHMNFSHQLAWIRAARRVNPSKYTGAYWQHAFLADLMWVSPWLMTFDPVGSYFKFNLEHGAFYTYLRLETIPIFWERAYKGFRIMRKALGHHLQAHFNACEIGAAPWQVETLGGETRSLLRLFLKRHRRAVAFTTTGVETTVYEPLSLSLPYADVVPDAPTTGWTISKYPLPPDKRTSTDFLWQRDPFRLTSGGDGTKQSPGIDYTLPYWMGRYYGVFSE